MQYLEFLRCDGNGPVMKVADIFFKQFEQPAEKGQDERGEMEKRERERQNEDGDEKYN